jgi:hypothetical protein
MALITAAEAREYIPGLASTGDDTQIGNLISAFDNAMAAYCGYPAYDAAGTLHTFEDQTYTLYAPDDVSGASISEDAQVLHVPRPLVSVTSIYEDEDWSYGAATEVANTNWVLDKARGRIILYPESTHGEWSTEWRALKVTVVCGYATVPESLKLAAKMLVGHWYQLRSRHGKQSLSGMNAQESLRPETWPDAVLQILSNHIQRGALL